MKLYRAVIIDSQEGTSYAWFTSRRAAEKHLSSVIADVEPEGPNSVELVEIATDRNGLCDWLNRNFTTDNG